MGVACEWSIGSQHTSVLLQQKDSSSIHLFLRQQLNSVLKVREADVVETIPEIQKVTLKFMSKGSNNVYTHTSTHMHILREYT